MRGTLGLLFLSLFLLVPFHEVFYHFVIKNRIGAGAVVIYPEHLLLLALVWIFRFELGIALRRWRLEMTLLAVYALA
ncbi:MAG: hypothetical protein M3R34_09175, partial [Acidobacteriota bacterium]|nr:hypothetical protein [Acidobacteriota bacterium]